MVEIAPFPAIRYNPAKVSNLSLAICPPYDVISVPQYDKLLKRHPQNIVRIELPLAQGTKDRYEIAAQLWNRWRNQRILIQDKEPAYYGYEQRFSTGMASYFRRGFFAALRLEKPGEGHVRPHERTFPKHKEDRLRLMRATSANVSPIFGIFFDRHKKAQKLLEHRMTEKPLTVTRDDKGVTHRLWRWSDAEARKALSGALSAEDVLIADGHHRYETAWNYAQEKLAHSRSSGRRQAYRFVMTFLCPLSDPGLVIQPTHRAVRWSMPWDDWQQRLEKNFSIQRLTGLNALVSRLRSNKEGNSLGVVAEGGKLLWLRPKSTGESHSFMPVVPLHEQILKDVPLDNISYGQDPRNMVQTLQRGECNLVFLLPPPDKQAFAAICRAGRRLPQKSTYFYPKLGTGLVMRTLAGGVEG
ncbi:MAG TPA: DUF1015 domain-containing protein [Elusimicrobiota bacterium]|nr:DUF1015 domain-containing protein [Elusimicrobiota bacterium]